VVESSLARARRPTFEPSSWLWERGTSSSSTRRIQQRQQPLIQALFAIGTDVLHAVPANRSRGTRATCRGDAHRPYVSAASKLATTASGLNGRSTPQRVEDRAPSAPRCVEGQRHAVPLPPDGLRRQRRPPPSQEFKAPGRTASTASAQKLSTSVSNCAPHSARPEQDPRLRHARRSLRRSSGSSCGSPPDDEHVAVPPKCRS